jgi:alanine racemase
MARAVLTIDLDAVAANWRALDALTPPGVETAAVVKADGYGLGAGPVARRLNSEGARTFFTALAEEAAVVREALGDGPSIHFFSGLLPGDSDLCRSHDLIPCLNSAPQVAEFVEKLTGRPCALQVDSGMNRLGMEADEAAGAADLIARAAPGLVMSHLACADEPDHPMNAAQAETFERIAATLPAARRSLSATGGILLGPRWRHDLTRPGIGLYGGAPFANALPVVTLSLPVIQVRDVAPGECVGYGAAWTATRPSRVATLDAGYADGLIRAMGAGGVQLYAGDAACPLVGRVSMDLITVDVTDLAHVPAHLDILNARQTVDDLAQAARTIGYEILTGLGGRYHRVYKGAAQPPDP